MVLANCHRSWPWEDVHQLPAFAGMQRALIDALCGVPKGVYSVDIPPDRKFCPQFHRGVTILIIETPCTLWTDVLIRKLKGVLIIKLKGEVTPFWRQNLLPQSDSRGNRL